MEITTYAISNNVEAVVSEPILRLNEKERDTLRAVASGEFSQEEIQKTFFKK